jgi:hypothetical protein
MSNLDQAIRQALSAEDAEFLARFDKEAPLHEQMLGTFSGPFGLLNIFAAVLTFSILGAFCYSVWQFFQISEVRDLIFWSGAALLSALAVAMLKIWFWMEVQKNQVLREVKRLELQVARLATREAA